VGIKSFCLKKSLWLFHFGGASCNNCDIEILDCLTPRFDVERFGMLLVGSPRHADVILVNGSINKRDREDSWKYMSRLQSHAWWLLSGPADARGEYLPRGILSPDRWTRSYLLMHIYRDARPNRKRYWQGW
jgi:hypothetical protein